MISDAAATAFQKPRTVAAAVERAMHYMTTPGRGAYQKPGWRRKRPFAAAAKRRLSFMFPARTMWCLLSTLPMR